MNFGSSDLGGSDTIPNGGNPTGASLDLARKQRIYQIARDFGLLILEDDPYHWLQVTHHEHASSLISTHQHSSALISTQWLIWRARTITLRILYHWQFAPERCKSLMSIDVDGRVLRFDSFSKLLACVSR